MGLALPCTYGEKTLNWLFLPLSDEFIVALEKEPFARYNPMSDSIIHNL